MSLTLPQKIVKRDGSIVDFDAERIRKAIKKALKEVKQYNRELLEKLVNEVLKIVSQKYSDGKIPHVEDIQNIVEFVLVKEDLYEVAKAYILYRKEREREREEKKKVLDGLEPDKLTKKVLSLNAVRVLASRYLLKDPQTGKIIETPLQMFKRVAAHIALPDILYSPEFFSREPLNKKFPKEEFDAEQYEGKIILEDYPLNRWNLQALKRLYDRLNEEGHMKKSWSQVLERLLGRGVPRNAVETYRRFLKMLTSLQFMPNSPTLFNAGTKLGQLSACFVLKIDDTLAETECGIMNTAKYAALIFQSGGGIGINYSSLRPEGDIVSSTVGVASGPVSFMWLINAVTEVIKQGGRRRGANMGILEAWHPDIEKFITCKEKEGFLENFNISVLLDDVFWRCYEGKKPYPLINPRTGQVVGKIDSRRLMKMIAYEAWKTGDPGVLFKDNINKYNVMKPCLGDINATNPCGEQPLYPFESCNLGSINLYAFVKRDKHDNVVFDWKELAKVVKTAVHFLDNVIDVNNFPIREIEESTLKLRRIGLGMMGLADTLYALGIRYNSEEGFRFMSQVTQFIAYHAYKASIELAKKRGPFPLFSKSDYVKGLLPIRGYYNRDEWIMNWEEISREARNGIRNAFVLTVAPTGSISMICDVSSGLEPQYALVYKKNVTIGTFYYIDKEFLRYLKENGLYSEELLRKIAENGGTLQGLDFPEKVKEVFVTAREIPWWDHVRAQYEIQKWIDASVSKTINMPEQVSPEDVEKAYIFAYRLGLKGITIYRDRCRSTQVISSERHEVKPIMVKNETIKMMERYGLKPTRPESSIHGNDLKVLVQSKGDAQTPMQSFLEAPQELKAEGKVGVDICPACGSRLAHKEGCVSCPICGWSACSTC